MDSITRLVTGWYSGLANLVEEYALQTIIAILIFVAAFMVVQGVSRLISWGKEGTKEMRMRAKRRAYVKQRVEDLVGFAIDDAVEKKELTLEEANSWLFIIGNRCGLTGLLPREVPLKEAIAMRLNTRFYAKRAPLPDKRKEKNIVTSKTKPKTA